MCNCPELDSQEQPPVPGFLSLKLWLVRSVLPIRWTHNNTVEYIHAYLIQLADRIAKKSSFCGAPGPVIDPRTWQGTEWYVIFDTFGWIVS